MKSLLKFAAAFSLLFSSAPASAEEDPDWYSLGTDKTGTELLARKVDIFAGRSNQTSAKLWIKLEASKDKSVNWRYAVVLYRVNCVNETFQQIQINQYFPDGSNNQIDGSPSTSNFAPPGSYIALAMEILCYDPTTPTTDYR